MRLVALLIWISAALAESPKAPAKGSCDGKPPVAQFNESVVSSAWACYSQRSSYIDKLGSAYKQGQVSTSTSVLTSSATSYVTKTIYPSSVSIYTLQDGSPRADVRPVTETKTRTSIQTYSQQVLHGIGLDERKCNPGPAGCRFLYYNTTLGSDDQALLATCGSPPHLCEPCMIQGGPVQLLYFPTTENSTIGLAATATASGSPITTVVTMNTTLTSGTVYMSFSTIYAYWDGFGDRIGRDFSDIILPFASSDVSTQCGGWTASHGPGTAMNFNDLNYPVPASAYSCAGRCATQYSPVKECSTIWSDFNPVLALPPQIRTMDPAWASCSFWNGALPNFVFDPPVVLTSQAVFAVPTFTTTASSQATQSSVVTPGASVSVVQPTSSVGRQSPSAPQSSSEVLPASTTAVTSRADDR
ncbi:hypothetical protein B9Z65_2572 [Elsinoe australis]|uniref:Uncharacterized protein n=1 Tax=Elsinoe australis TaxID=40998 RepID=A0A2P8A406_9PEZI|nr:hypothetical protein B9Z65_2572 [Elsinoe australis]